MPFFGTPTKRQSRNVSRNQMSRVRNFLRHNILNTKHPERKTPQATKRPKLQNVQILNIPSYKMSQIEKTPHDYQRMPIALDCYTLIVCNK
jgi:hypothetical protein